MINIKQYKKYFDKIIDENNIILEYKEKQDNTNFELVKMKNNISKEYFKNHNKDYDGVLYELMDIKINNDKIYILYNYSNYSDVIALKNIDYCNNLQINNIFIDNHIAIPIILITKDNKIIISSDLTFKKNHQNWKFIGGFWEQKNKTIGDCIKTECEEELGYKITEKNIKIIGIYKYNNNVYINSFIRLNLNSLEINNLFNNHIDNNINNEIKFIKFMNFDKKNIRNILQNDLLELSPATNIAFYSLLKNFNNCYKD